MVEHEWKVKGLNGLSVVSVRGQAPTVILRIPAGQSLALTPDEAGDLSSILWAAMVHSHKTEAGIDAVQLV